MRYFSYMSLINYQLDFFTDFVSRRVRRPTQSSMYALLGTKTRADIVSGTVFLAGFIRKKGALVCCLSVDCRLFLPSDLHRCRFHFCAAKVPTGNSQLPAVLLFAICCSCSCSCSILLLLPPNESTNYLRWRILGHRTPTWAHPTWTYTPPTSAPLLPTQKFNVRAFIRKKNKTEKENRAEWGKKNEIVVGQTLPFSFLIFRGFHRRTQSAMSRPLLAQCQGKVGLWVAVTCSW